MPNPPAKPKVVLITGAAGGLGSALSAAFAGAGWQVVAGWHSTPPEMTGPLIWPIQLDVTEANRPAEVVSEVQARFRRLDVLINNAGIAQDSLVAQLSEENWERVLAVNLKGAWLCAQAALGAMLPQRDGHILNIASFGGRVGRAGQANYAASKAGLLGLTQSLAWEVGPHNIRVNAMLPGFLRTKLVGELSELQLSQHAASNTLGRLNDAREVARFAVFVAEMKNVSGQVFQLDSRIAPWG